MQLIKKNEDCLNLCFAHYGLNNPKVSGLDRRGLLAAVGNIVGVLRQERWGEFKRCERLYGNFRPSFVATMLPTHMLSFTILLSHYVSRLQRLLCQSSLTTYTH